MRGFDEWNTVLFELGQKGGKVWGLQMIFGFAAAMSLGCVCFSQPYMHAYSSRTAKGLKAMFLSFGGICIIIITMPILVGIASTILFVLKGGSSKILMPQPAFFNLEIQFQTA